MAAINFPSSPTVGAYYSEDGKTVFVWNGSYWERVTALMGGTSYWQMLRAGQILGDGAELILFGKTSAGVGAASLRAYNGTANYAFLTIQATGGANVGSAQFCGAELWTAANAGGTRLGCWDGTAHYVGSFNSASNSRSAIQNPNQYVRSLTWEFKDGTAIAASGNYRGLLTLAPWDSTAASTGDPTYQMAFIPTAANSTSPPHIYVRSGIDTTWGGWQALIKGDAGYTDSTPTVTAVTGTFTTVSAALRRELHGSFMHWTLTITITTNGTAATAIQVAMPFTAAKESVAAGSEAAVTGNMCKGVMAASSSTLNVTKYDNTYPGGDGYRISLSGITAV